MALMENSIVPIQQFRNTVGKNATGFHINYYRCHGYFVYGEWTGSCIVSSDGDFTSAGEPLKRIRHGRYRHGENKPPWSFRAACSVFTDLELLLEAAEEEEETPVRKAEKDS